MGVRQLVSWDTADGQKPTPELFEIIESTLAAMHGRDVKAGQTRVRSHSLMYTHLRQGADTKPAPGHPMGKSLALVHFSTSHSDRVIILVNRETRHSLQCCPAMLSIMDKMSFKKGLSLEYKGRVYTFGDFVVRLSKVFHHSTFGAISLDVEYLPLSNIAAAQPAIAAFVDLLSDALPPGCGGRFTMITLDSKHVPQGINLLNHAALQYCQQWNSSLQQQAQLRTAAPTGK